MALSDEPSLSGLAEVETPDAAAWTKPAWWSGPDQATDSPDTTDADETSTHENGVDKNGSANEELASGRTFTGPYTSLTVTPATSMPVSPAVQRRPSSRAVRFGLGAAAAVLLVVAVTVVAFRSTGAGSTLHAEPVLATTQPREATSGSTAVSQPTPDPASATPRPQPSTDSTVLVAERFSSGQLPRDWTPVTGTWKVVDGRLQATTDDARARISFGPKAPRNYRIETLVRFVRVSDSRRWLNVGLDYHVKQDRGALFVARSDTTLTNGLELAQRKEPGDRYLSRPVRSASAAIGVGEDHRLTIEVRGRRVNAWLDGRRAFTASNLSRNGGGFGFVINNSTVQFDDVQVTRLND